MNLFRVIAILVIVWLVVYIVKRTLGQRQPKESLGRQQRRSEKVVRCARCGVHVPESEAVREGDRFYCSPAHREEDRT